MVDAQRNEEIIRTFLSRWGAGEMAEALELVDENAVYTLHASPDLLVAGGELVGRAAILAAFCEVRRRFEYVLFRPFAYVADLNRDFVRVRVEYMYRHLKSGEMLAGVFRLEFELVNGVAVRGAEFHDRAKLEAFLRLFDAPGA